MVFNYVSLLLSPQSLGKENKKFWISYNKRNYFAVSVKDKCKKWTLMGGFVGLNSTEMYYCAI